MVGFKFSYKRLAGVDTGLIWHKMVCIRRFLWTQYFTVRFDVNSESVCCIWDTVSFSVRTVLRGVA